MTQNIMQQMNEESARDLKVPTSKTYYNSNGNMYDTRGQFKNYSKLNNPVPMRGTQELHLEPQPYLGSVKYK